MLQLYKPLVLHATKTNTQHALERSGIHLLVYQGFPNTCMWCMQAWKRDLTICLLADGLWVLCFVINLQLELDFQFFFAKLRRMHLHEKA